MKKVFTILVLSILIAGCVYAENNTIKINDVDFKLPDKYLDGDLKENSYRLDNIFSIRCIDNDTAKAIGLWAEENQHSNDLTIGNHPVRHYCQYNKYVNGNHSHAYFASGNSIYEISWVGDNINSDIEKLINDTPSSKINDDDFYDILDKSVEIYKQQKIDKLNQDGEYNYLESKYQSQYPQDSFDDTRFREILLTYYNH